MSQDRISITTSAKAIIIRNDGLLVVAKRYSDGLAYIPPGGTQEHGESLDASLQRECQEEIGTPVEIDGVLFVREYIGKNHEYSETDSHLHIVEVLFSCRVPDDYVAQMGPLPDDDQEAVVWLPLADLNRFRLYPATLKQALIAQSDPPVYLGDVN